MIEHISSKTNQYMCYGFDLFEDLRIETFLVKHQTHDIKNKWNILNVAYCDDLQKSLTEFWL